MTHLEVHSGRLFASDGSNLWWSEPFRFNLFNMTEGFVQLDSAIRMVRSVLGGLFVSTNTKTYFLSGNDPASFTLKIVSSFPAAEYSDSSEKVEGGGIGYDPGSYLLWASQEGAILGTPGGSIANLNKSKIIYPEEVSKGFGCLIGYEFLHGMN